MTAVAIEPGKYGCPVCSKRFVLLKDKKKHVRTVHPR